LVLADEVEEVRYFLILGRDLGYLQQAEFAKVEAQCHVVAKLVNALSTSLSERIES